MANLRVFVSSTCYDLGPVRSQLRNFLEQLGFDPVLSEYKDVLFDPRLHTHTSCVEEVASVDVVILLLGGRFGGKAVPQAISLVDVDQLAKASRSIESLKSKEDLSVTQLEVLRAIEAGIPVFAFVDDRVMNDHATYEKNKSKAIIADLEFASIEKPETAKFIFEFINFLRLRSANNAIIAFSTFNDLEDALKRQFSALLQRLLSEVRRRSDESRRINNLSEQLEALKAAVLTAVGSENEKQVARAVVRFRRLIDFVRGFDSGAVARAISDGCSWGTLLERLDIKQVVELEPNTAKNIGLRFASAYRNTSILLRKDGHFYTVRIPISIPAMEDDWSAFMELPIATRQVVYGALAEMYPSPIGRYVRLEEPTWDQIQRKVQREMSLSGPEQNDADSASPISDDDESDSSI